MKKLLFLSLIVILYSCEKEKEHTAGPIFSAMPGSIYISNEGNFQSSNASVSNYYPSSGSVATEIFIKANGRPLGDICQSMKLINGSLYLVINNSGKIEVCDLKTLIVSKTITGFTSPRYITSVNQSKAYVTDGYANAISIINLTDNTISGTIPLQGFCEELLLVNNHVYVANSSSEYLYVVDTVSDVIGDSILISKGANSICTDMSGDIWVLCGGDYMGTYNGGLHRIDPSTGIVEQSLSFQPNEFPSKLRVSPAGNAVYFLNNGVWKVNISATSLPSTPFIASSGNNFYGLGIDPVRNEVYVSDAIDFIQNGRIYRYDSNGNAIANFLAEIIPGDFLFLP